MRVANIFLVKFAEQFLKEHIGPLLPIQVWSESVEPHVERLKEELAAAMQKMIEADRNSQAKWMEHYCTCGAKVKSDHKRGCAGYLAQALRKKTKRGKP